MTGMPLAATFAVVLSLGSNGDDTGHSLQAERGEALYQQLCTSCHSPDRNRYGPLHRGVVGRSAGTVPDYNYSEALASAAMIWNAETLNAWLADPATLVPGTRMRFRVPDNSDRADIIAYLATLTAPPASEAPPRNDGD